MSRLYIFSSVTQSCPTLCDPMNRSSQASLSNTNSQSLPKLMSVESVMPSSHLILCCPLLLLPQSLPASKSFPMSQLFAWGGQSIGVSALASVLNSKANWKLEAVVYMDTCVSLLPSSLSSSSYHHVYVPYVLLYILHALTHCILRTTLSGQFYDYVLLSFYPVHGYKMVDGLYQHHISTQHQSWE